MNKRENPEIHIQEREIRHSFHALIPTLRQSHGKSYAERMLKKTCSPDCKIHHVIQELQKIGVTGQMELQ